MLDKSELSKIGIHQWDEGFGDHFIGSDIFVGNGFSINLCDRLNYKALLELFVKHAEPALVKIFHALETSNFEYVMDTLRISKIVCKQLGIEITEVDLLIEHIKNGLVLAIQDSHPTYKETNFPLMEALAIEFTAFKDIYTTNYDIFLYRIILATNELIKNGHLDGPDFQDDFYIELSATELGFGGSFDDSLRKIYYLHGSLFFYRKLVETYKLRRIDEIEYIKLIRREISNNNFPVFVAEGSSTDKQLAINNNAYLSYCSNQLKRKRKEPDQRLTVYGSSFSPSDNHLISYINTSGIREMAVSLFPNRTKDELEAEKSRINVLFGRVEITYYDSRSLFNFDRDIKSYPSLRGAI